MPQFEDVYEPPIMDTTGQAIANAIQGLNPTVPSFISDAFSVERSYSTGDIVIYENKVYVFTSNKSAGAWDSTKVTETTIGAICTATNASLTQKQDTISPIAPTSDNATFETGGYFLIGNLVILDVTFTVGSGGATTGLRLLKDLPSTTQNDKPIFGMMMGSVNNNMTSMRIYGGGLYSNTSIGAGRYHVYGMYVTSI